VPLARLRGADGEGALRDSARSPFWNLLRQMATSQLSSGPAAP
jgi:hypothetical protein